MAAGLLKQRMGFLSANLFVKGEGACAGGHGHNKRQNQNQAEYACNVFHMVPPYESF